VEQGPNCRRCRADLSPLFSLEQKRQALLTAASHLIRFGHVREAAALIHKSEEMQRDSSSARLLALCALLSRDFTSAWRLYQREAKMKKPGQILRLMGYLG
jgi:hypothetical protein